MGLMAPAAGPSQSAVPGTQLAAENELSRQLLCRIFIGPGAYSRLEADTA